MMKKLLAAVLAAATLVTVTPEAIFAEENLPVTETEAVDDILRISNEEQILFVPLAEGQELGEAIALAEARAEVELENEAVDDTDVEMPTDEFSFERKQFNDNVPGGNEYTYVGVLEDQYKNQVFIRIPYWFSNTFPNTKWYFVGKNKLQVWMPVYPKTGSKGKKFTKKVTLPRDSRLWLGGWGDYNNELIVSPWIQKAFQLEATTVSDGSDPDLGTCKVIVLRAWKNKKAFARRKNPIVKVIHYVDYNHYRVTTTDQYAGNVDDGGGTIIID